MSLKMMKNTLLVSAFVAASSFVVVGCGDSGSDGKKDSGPGEPEDDAGADGEDAGGTSEKPFSFTDYSVVGVLDLKPVAPVHDVELLSAETGLPLDPPLKTKTEAGTGKFSFKDVPGKYRNKLWIHVTGAGPKSEPTSTYDSLSYGPLESGDTLIRISTVGTAGVAEATGAFTGKLDQVAIGGAVYMVDGSGKRIGAVGCAQIFIDDNKTVPMADGDPKTDDATDPNVIRYVGSSGLPLPLGMAAGKSISKTLANSGKFFIGNVTKGKHTFKVSIDGGSTFIAEQELFVPFSRSEASGDFKGFLVLFGIDVKGTNPTPSGCPTSE